MEYSEVGEIMTVLTVAYPQFYSKQSPSEKGQALALWTEMFKEYPATVVAYAVKAYISEDTKGFPPSIGQILERIHVLTDKQSMSAEEAWGLVYKAICRSGWHAEEEFGKLPPEAKEIVRSQHQLWMWAMDEKFNAGVESSNFKRAYNARAAERKRIEALPEDVKAFIGENDWCRERITSDI